MQERLSSKRGACGLCSCDSAGRTRGLAEPVRGGGRDGPQDRRCPRKRCFRSADIPGVRGRLGVCLDVRLALLGKGRAGSG